MVIALALAVELSVRGKTPVHRKLIPRSALLVQHLQRSSGLISGRTLQRGTYRHKSGSQGDSFEEPALTGEDFSRVDDTLLDLEPEDSSTNAPLTGISPLRSLPAPLPAQNILAMSCTLGLVHQSTTDSSALFRVPNPVSQSVSQDIPLPGYAPHFDTWQTSNCG